MAITNFYTLVLSILYLVMSGVCGAREIPKSREDIWEAIRTYHARISPGTEIPMYPEYATWRITGSIAGTVVYKTDVPVKVFDSLSGASWAAGKIKVGTEVKLNFHRNEGGRIFYEVEAKDVTDRNKATHTFWVDGSFIERDPAASFSPPKDFLRSPLFKGKREQAK